MEAKNIRIVKDGMDTNFFYQEMSPEPSPAFGGANRIFTSRGLIPMEISAKGEEAIKEYAEEIVREDIDKQKLEAEWQEDFAIKSNFPIAARAEDGVLVKGKILSITHGKLVVRLESPKKYYNSGKSKLTYDYLHQNNKQNKMEAILFSDIFSSDMRGFSRKIVGDAQKLLLQIYDRQKTTMITMS